MKILIVDDTEVIRLLVSRFVEAMGHIPVTANNGAEAVEAFRKDMPDVVLLDMLMPVMDGPQAARLIKRQAGERWIPIIFVTAIGEENRLADAIEQGADDYIIKPINLRILEAKIKAIERTVLLNRKVREQSVKLAEYYDHAEEEKRVARHLMDQLVNAERLSDPQIEYWISPAESLSGDLIAAARTPGQVLHLLLADGIGHGLTAALNVLPLTQPFYTMTEKGFTLKDILAEMNDKIRQVLPRGRFVATALLAIDNINRQIEVWNGGIPDVFLLGKEGHLIKSWRSRNLPLGILPTRDLEMVTEHHFFEGDETLMVCSDGLIEARRVDGEQFGSQRVLASVESSPPTGRMQGLVDALGRFLDGLSHHDDVSVVMVSLAAGQSRSLSLDCESVYAGDSDLELADALLAEHSFIWRQQLSLGAEELRRVNSVPYIMGLVDQICTVPEVQSDIFLILTELFVNAVDHGLLKLSSTLKHDAEGMESYLQEREQRLANLQEGRIDIELMGLRVQEKDVFRLRVRDSGEGFDWIRYSPPRNVEIARPAHGRGILLVRALCPIVEYSGLGNEVIAYYVPKTHLLVDQAAAGGSK
ncbi:ATP-binding SpoIIE family protein phosphatase [Parachitinimonas caeni]|uniref:Fused response regulator/phosphatase n=1 Tax=Parachitinimonas caeni TaxID=3031301 RepID=A0ABT7DUQ7_9NEIS|nr:fused response regulator/phosphatase [Parachitinimonas caeni]MDK2123799.1 fused response regulator/phosphatase [Parachitinimonas caeni]